MIPLIWYGGKEKWDQDVVEVIAPLDTYVHLPADAALPRGETGAVVVIPGAAYAESIPAINRYLASLEWVIVLLTSDEESLFLWHRLTHPNMRIWVQCPHPVAHKNPSLRYLPLGWPWHQTDTFTGIAPDHVDVLSWFFHGQVTHQRRDDMLTYMQEIEDGKGIPSPGFTQGMPRREYLHSMALSKVCPSPSGPASPDTFRTWEALEAGAVPIVDQGPKPDEQGRAKVGYPPGFWSLLLGQEPPFPVVEEWEDAPAMVDFILQFYPAINNSVFAWWQRKKFELRNRLLDDVEELSGQVRAPRTIDALITVLVPTSPVPGNPSLEHLDTTLQSVRSRLPKSLIYLMFDGIRTEQQDRWADYEEYQRRVLWLCNHFWTDVIPFRYEKHLHQAEMTRLTLEHVRTPLVLFVEHDTPLCNDIEWDVCAGAVMDNQYDVIRFYPEKILQPEHEHLMGERNGVFQETVQWSQRPHLAWTDYYRRIINDHFEAGERAMIEDRMHGIAQSYPDEHLIAIYAPEGKDVQRSHHLDARKEDPKWSFG